MCRRLVIHKTLATVRWAVDVLVTIQYDASQGHSGGVRRKPGYTLATDCSQDKRALPTVILCTMSDV